MDANPGSEVWWAGRILRWTHLARVGRQKLREERERPRKPIIIGQDNEFDLIRRLRSFQWSQNSVFHSTFHATCKCLLVIQHIMDHLPCQFSALSSLSLILPTSLWSLKPSSSLVPSRNMIGLTRFGYSKDPILTLCSLHPKVNLSFCSKRSSIPEGGLWSQFWYNDPLVFYTLST